MKETKIEGHLVFYYCPYCNYQYIGDLTKKFTKVTKCRSCSFVLLKELLLQGTKAKFIKDKVPQRVFPTP